MLTFGSCSQTKLSLHTTRVLQTTGNTIDKTFKIGIYSKQLKLQDKVYFVTASNKTFFPW